MDRVTECAYGVFYRTIELPPGADPSSIEATMSNGVLKIRMPKPSHAGAKKIEVKEGQIDRLPQRGADLQIGV